MSDEIYRILGRIEGKQDAMQSDITEIKTSVDKHNNRILSLEGFKLQIMAFAGFLAAGVTVVWELIKTIVGKI